jgi:hypothetical protein
MAQKLALTGNVSDIDWNKEGTIVRDRPMEHDAELPTCLDALCALERAVEKEWWWLSGALHAVAEVSAEVANAPVGRLRELQAQMLNLDRKRVEIAVRIASILGPGGASASGLRLPPGLSPR